MDHLVQAFWGALLLAANALLVAVVATPRVVVLLSRATRSPRRRAMAAAESGGSAAAGDHEDEILRVVVQNTDRGTMRGPIRLELHTSGALFGEFEDLTLFAAPTDWRELKLVPDKFVMWVPDERALTEDPDLIDSLRGNKTWVIEVPLKPASGQLQVTGVLEMHSRAIKMPNWLRPVAWFTTDTRRLHIRYPARGRGVATEVERYTAFVRGDRVVIAVINLVGIAGYGLAISVLPTKFDWLWDGGTVAVCCALASGILMRVRNRVPPMIQGYLSAARGKAASNPRPSA